MPCHEFDNIQWHCLILKYLKTLLLPRNLFFLHDKVKTFSFSDLYAYTNQKTAAFHQDFDSASSLQLTTRVTHYWGHFVI